MPPRYQGVHPERSLKVREIDAFERLSGSQSNVIIHPLALHRRDNYGPARLVDFWTPYA